MAASRQVVERVRALLRLAANNPNEEEARSAALHAARLIANHQLVVTDSSSDPDQVRLKPDTTTTRAWWMKRHDRVTYTIVVILLGFMVWKSFFP